MIALLSSLMTGTPLAAEAARMRTVISCGAHEVVGNPLEKTGPGRRFSILLEGDGPFKAPKTIDPSRLLGGEIVRDFQVVPKSKDYWLVARTGEAEKPSTWDLLIYQKDTGRFWDLAVGRGGKLEFSGHCTVMKKSMTANEAENVAIHWHAQQ